MVTVVPCGRRALLDKLNVLRADRVGGDADGNQRISTRQAIEGCRAVRPGCGPQRPGQRFGHLRRAVPSSSGHDAWRDQRPGDRLAVRSLGPDGSRLRLPQDQRRSSILHRVRA